MTFISTKGMKINLIKLAVTSMPIRGRGMYKRKENDKSLYYSNGRYRKLRRKSREERASVKERRKETNTRELFLPMH
jgi:hypothetical protein